MHLRSLLLASFVFWSLASLAAAQAGSAPASSTGAASTADRTEEAKGLFNAGRAAFDAGRYTDALDYFRRSYAISGRPALLYNIAITLDRLREDQQALDAYEEYLEKAPTAENRVEVETRAAAIRDALARRQPAPAQEVAPAPTPEETAQAAPAEPAPAVGFDAGAQPEARDGGDGGLLTKWWFWTAVGVVVAGGVTATVLALSGGEESATPLEPRSGVIVTTLRSAP